MRKDNENIPTYRQLIVPTFESAKVAKIQFEEKGVMSVDSAQVVEIDMKTNIFRTFAALF